MTGWMELKGVESYDYRLTKISDACGGTADPSSAVVYADSICP